MAKPSATNPLHIRCKHRSGSGVLNNLTHTSTVRDLRNQLAGLTAIPANRLSVLKGFPPRKLDTSSPLATLAELGIASGDVLTVEEMPVTEDKILMRHAVPSDNSCLFSSVSFALTGATDPSGSKRLRQLIAKVISSDKETYTEAMLERSNKDYCKWIENSDSWGGAIEVAILSDHFEVEIVVVDTKSASLARFGEVKRFGRRILLLYNGIHYDPLVLESATGSDPAVTTFPTSDETVLMLAQDLADEAQKSRQFTDLHGFKLQCMTCDVKLIGQADLHQHAQETGHMNFGEIG